MPDWSAVQSISFVLEPPSVTTDQHRIERPPRAKARDRVAKASADTATARKGAQRRPDGSKPHEVAFERLRWGHCRYDDLRGVVAYRTVHQLIHCNCCAALPM